MAKGREHWTHVCSANGLLMLSCLSLDQGILIKSGKDLCCWRVGGELRREILGTCRSDSFPFGSFDGTFSAYRISYLQLWCQFRDGNGWTQWIHQINSRGCSTGKTNSAKATRLCLLQKVIVQPIEDLWTGCVGKCDTMPIMLPRCFRFWRPWTNDTWSELPKEQFVSANLQNEILQIRKPRCTSWIFMALVPLWFFWCTSLLWFLWQLFSSHLAIPTWNSSPTGTWRQCNKQK